MTFEAGKSGNPGGRPKARPFKEALMMEALAAERGEECEALPGSLRWNARKLLQQGDVSSIREVADRIDGKVPQAVVGDNSEDPINFVAEVRRVIVDPKP
jgi:hypothetical protein